MYVLIDVTNGDALEIKTAAKIYFWAFKTLKQAKEHLRKQNREAEKYGSKARLVGPFRLDTMVVASQGAEYNELRRVE